MPSGKMHQKIFRDPPGECKPNIHFVFAPCLVSTSSWGSDLALKLLNLGKPLHQKPWPSQQYNRLHISTYKSVPRFITFLTWVMLRHLLKSTTNKRELGEKESAARIRTKTIHFDHISPVLLVQSRCDFKIFTVKGALCNICVVQFTLAQSIYKLMLANVASC